MDTRGLVIKYKVNRPLTTRESDRHALQSEPSSSKPLYQNKIIRMNSTYLECVDKFFADKGMMTASMIFLVGIFIPVLYLGFLTAFEKHEYGYASIIFIMVIPLQFVCIKFLILKECFIYTHYPIRFNRKTRKVHVFRIDGTVMTEDWDKLYFTLCQCEGMDMALQEMRVHRMAEDRKTVLETFALPVKDTPPANVYAFWEFVRRYMENPDELPELAKQVDEVIDIADKREGFWSGFGRLYAEPGEILPYILFPIWFPICLCYALGRWIATHTSRIPRWPAEIEAECQIEENDPNLRDAHHLT
jgi:hypothetical protein